MNVKKWISTACMLLIINCIQFLILADMAILFYPGGTFTDPNTIGYSIWNNLLSDLGRFVAHSGESNLITFFLYNISLFLMGLLLIPFFIMKTQFFKERGEGKTFCIVGSILGIIIAVAIMGASLAPADVFYSIHVSFGFLNFILLLPLTILYSFAIFQNKNYPNRYAFVYIVFGIIQFIFLITMFFSASETEMSIEFAAGQNMLIYAMTVCFLIQGYGGWRLQKSMKYH